LNDSELKTLNFQNDFSDNNIDTVFDLEGALIENLSINTNDFKIEFKYDDKMLNLLNFKEVYNSICDYLKLHFNTNLKVEIKTPQLSNEIERDIKVEIINLINSLTLEKITKSYLHSKLNDLSLHDSFFIKLDNILSNQEELLIVFDNELNEEILEFEDINDLIEKYPHVEFYCDDRIINNPTEFMNFQVQKLSDLEDNKLIQNKKWIRSLLGSWANLRFKFAAKELDLI
jgi:hypothetical protein